MQQSDKKNSTSENWFVCEFVWSIRSLVWVWMMNVFVSTIGFVRCGGFSWPKGERPGTRTLAAWNQKNFVLSCVKTTWVLKFCKLCIFSLWTVVLVSSVMSLVLRSHLFITDRHWMFSVRLTTPLGVGGDFKKFTFTHCCFMTKFLLHSHRSCSSQESFPAKVFLSRNLEIIQETTFSRWRGNRFRTGELQARGCFQPGLTSTFQFMGNLNQKRQICWRLQTPFEIFHALGV